MRECVSPVPLTGEKREGEGGAAGGFRPYIVQLENTRGLEEKGGGGISR